MSLTVIEIAGLSVSHLVRQDVKKLKNCLAREITRENAQCFVQHIFFAHPDVRYGTSLHPFFSMTVRPILLLISPINKEQHELLIEPIRERIGRTGTEKKGSRDVRRGASGCEHAIARVKLDRYSIYRARSLKNWD